MYKVCTHNKRKPKKSNKIEGWSKNLTKKKKYKKKLFQSKNSTKVLVTFFLSQTCMIQAVKSAKDDVCTNRLAAFIDLNEFLYSSINEFWVNFTEKENKKRSLIPSILMDSQKVHTDHYSSIKKHAEN